MKEQTANQWGIEHNHRYFYVLCCQAAILIAGNLFFDFTDPKMTITNLRMVTSWIEPNLDVDRLISDPTYTPESLLLGADPGTDAGGDRPEGALSMAQANTTLAAKFPQMFRENHLKDSLVYYYAELNVADFKKIENPRIHLNPVSAANYRILLNGQEIVSGFPSGRLEKSIPESISNTTKEKIRLVWEVENPAPDAILGMNLNTEMSVTPPINLQSLLSGLCGGHPLLLLLGIVFCYLAFRNLSKFETNGRNATVFSSLFHYFIGLGSVLVAEFLFVPYEESSRRAALFFVEPLHLVAFIAAMSAAQCTLFPKFETQKTSYWTFSLVIMLSLASLIFLVVPFWQGEPDPIRLLKRADYIHAGIFISMYVCHLAVHLRAEIKNYRDYVKNNNQAMIYTMYHRFLRTALMHTGLLISGMAVFQMVNAKATQTQLWPIALAGLFGVLAIVFGMSRLAGMYSQVLNCGLQNNLSIGDICLDALGIRAQPRKLFLHRCSCKISNCGEIQKLRLLSPHIGARIDAFEKVMLNDLMMLLHQDRPYSHARIHWAQIFQVTAANTEEECRRLILKFVENWRILRQELPTKWRADLQAICKETGVLFDGDHIVDEMKAILFVSNYEVRDISVPRFDNDVQEIISGMLREHNDFNLFVECDTWDNTYIHEFNADYLISRVGTDREISFVPLQWDNQLGVLIFGEHKMQLAS